MPFNDSLHSKKTFLSITNSNTGLSAARFNDADMGLVPQTNTFFSFVNLLRPYNKLPGFKHNAVMICSHICRWGGCGRACVTSKGSQSTAVGTAAPSAGHHRKWQPADVGTSRSAAWAPPAHSGLAQQLRLELRQSNPEQAPLCASVYLGWAELLSKQPDDEFHQAHVIFITQWLKVGTGDDNDLLGMSIQPDGEFMKGLLHTHKHTVPKQPYIVVLSFSVAGNYNNS